MRYLIRILEMTAVFDLIEMYSEINQEIIDKRLDPNGCNRHFRRATVLLKEIRDKLKQIEIRSASYAQDRASKDKSSIESSRRDSRDDSKSEDQSLKSRNSLWEYYKKATST
jgi:hypothetical protein